MKRIIILSLIIIAVIVSCKKPDDLKSIEIKIDTLNVLCNEVTGTTS